MGPLISETAMGQPDKWLFKIQTPYLLSCCNIYGCVNCARCPEGEKQWEGYHRHFFLFLHRYFSVSIHFFSGLLLPHSFELPVWTNDLCNTLKILLNSNSPLADLLIASVFLLRISDTDNSSWESHQKKFSNPFWSSEPFYMCSLLTKFLHDLLIGHLASLILPFVGCLRGCVSLRSRQRVDHRPCVHLTQHREENINQLVNESLTAFILFYVIVFQCCFLVFSVHVRWSTKIF